MNKRPPKKRNEKSNFPKRFLAYLNNNPRERIAAIIVVLLVIASGVTTALLIQRHLTIKEEGERYRQTQNDIDSLVSSLRDVRQFSGDVEEGQSCKRTNPSEGFTRGPIRCEAHAYIVYGVDSRDAALAVTDRVGETLKHSKTFTYENTDSLNQSPNGQDSVKLSVEYYEDIKTGLSCSVLYDYFYTVEPPSFSPPLPTVNSQRALVADLSCGGWTKGVYYPLVP